MTQRAVLTEDGYLLLEVCPDQWSDGDLMFYGVDTIIGGKVVIDDVDGFSPERAARLRAATADFVSWWMIDLFTEDDKTASDCVPELFPTREAAEAYLDAAERNGWDWDWVKRGEIIETKDYPKD